MIRYVHVHVYTWLLIAVITCGIYSQEKPEKCNVKIWYLDLVTEGVLSGKLSDEQVILKAKIEKMVDKYKNLGRVDGMVDCSILRMYEELLGEAPTDGQDTEKSSESSPSNEHESGEGKGKTDKSDDAVKENVKESDKAKTDELKGSDAAIKENVKESDKAKTDEQKESDEAVKENVKESDKDKTDELKESDAAKNDEPKKTDHDIDDKDKKLNRESADKAEPTDKGTESKDIGKDEGEETGTTGREENDDTSEDDFVDDTDLDDTDFGDDDDGEGDEGEEKGDGTEEDSSSNGEEEESENKDQESTGKASDVSDEPDSESSGLKESGSSEGEGSGPIESKALNDKDQESYSEKVSELSVDKDLESSGSSDGKALDEKADEPHEDKKSGSEDNKVRKKKIKLVEETVFDVRKGYIKIMKEVEVDEEDENVEEEDTENEESKKKIDHEEKGENDKNKPDESDDKMRQREREDEEKRQIEREEEKRQMEREEEKRQMEREEEKRKTEREEEEKRQEEERERVRKEKEVEDKKKETEKEKARKEEEEKEREHAKEEEQKKTSDDSCSGDNCDGNCNGDSGECSYKENFKDESALRYTAEANTLSDHKESEDDQYAWRQSHKQNNAAEDKEKEAKIADSVRDFTTDLHRFELLFQQRASEYASKIQNLEIMIIRLENQLLGERLNKQNSTSSFSKLENQILKLENELLKLNQSYSILKEENVMLNYRQRKYLELGHVNKEQSSMGNSTKHLELISKQQNKISELTALLMNHSALFDKLQSKSHALEEQNQALYQIVMNQTALISNIMKKMQELSEENMKHRRETQDLKTQMEIKTNSDRLLEKLNTLVSVQVHTGHDSFQKEDTRKIQEKEFSIHSFFPKSPDADVRPWRCNGNKSSRFCVFFSFIMSPCPPFSTVYWHQCPFYYKDISLEVSEQQVSSQMSKPTKLVSPTEEALATDNQVPSASTLETLVKVDDGASKESASSMSSEDGKVLEEILKPDKDAQTQDVTKEEKEEKEEVKANIIDSESEVRRQKSEEPPKGESKDEIKVKRDSEGSSRVPGVEKVAPQKPSDPSPEDREILYTTDKKLPKPRDCYEYMQNGYERNGMYKIYIVGQEKHLPVYCDMNGGWTLLMRRSSGGLDFYKTWDDYKKGFGNFYSEHWIGNDNLHYLTNQKHYSLKVVLEDFDYNSTFAEYEHFWIDNEDAGYRLHISGYSGTAGDGFDKHNKMKFSTKDADNDLITKELKEYDHSCAKRFHGAWWYYKCYMSNLTGNYYKTGHVPNKKFDGVSWKPWKKPTMSLKSAILMIRPFKAE